MPAEKRTELYVGVFIFTGLVLLGGLVLQFGKFADRMRGSYPLTVVFEDASGVIKGSEVRMGGARIGDVATLPVLNPALKVEVKLSINSAIRIPEGSKFQVNSATLLGDKLIVVIPPEARNHGSIAEGSQLAGAGPTGLDAIQNNAEIVSRDVMRMLKQAEATLGKVDGAVDDIRGASSQLHVAVGKINGSLLADQNLANFNRTLENLAEVSVRWKSASESMAPTLDEARVAIRSIQQAAASAEKTLQSADRTLAEVKPTLTRLPKAVDNFAEVTDQAGDALDRMKRGEGMLGAFASDNDVALDFKAFMRNLRQNGILRYKDGVRESKEKTEPKFGGRNR